MVNIITIIKHGVFALGLISALSGCKDKEGVNRVSESGYETEEAALQDDVVHDDLYSTYRSSNYQSYPECDVPNPDLSFELVPEFSTNNAYLLLLTSLLVEQPPGVAKEQFLKWGFQEVKVYNNWLFGTRAYIAEHNDFVLVSFRGTKTPGEYLSNAMAMTRPVDLYTPNDSELTTGRAHRGIWGVHWRTRSVVHKRIMQVNSENKPVIFTGHSRGGALASLQAAYFAEQGGEIEAVYTFAQPRLGNGTLSRAIDGLYGDRFYRMDFVKDVTPRVPPTADIAEPLHLEGKIPRWIADTVKDLGYDYDPGESYLLTETGEIIEDLDPYETQLNFWRDLFDQYPMPIFSIPELIKVFPENHNPRKYICTMARYF